MQLAVLHQSFRFSVGLWCSTYCIPGVFLLRHHQLKLKISNLERRYLCNLKALKSPSVWHISFYMCCVCNSCVAIRKKDLMFCAPFFSKTFMVLSKKMGGLFCSIIIWLFWQVLCISYTGGFDGLWMPALQWEVPYFSSCYVVDWRCSDLSGLQPWAYSSFWCNVLKLGNSSTGDLEIGLCE